MARRIRKSVLLACGTLFLVAASLAFFFLWTALSWSGQGRSSLARVSLSGNELPVTVSFFGRSEDSLSDTLSARVVLSDSEGSVLSTIERSWSGRELRIDCVTVATEKGWLVFPYSLSTDKTDSGHGVNLLGHYSFAGFPAIYESDRLTVGERKSLRTLFSVVRTEAWMPGFLGTLHHETAVMRSFEAGREYVLFISPDGKLSVR